MALAALLSHPALLGVGATYRYHADHQPLPVRSDCGRKATGMAREVARRAETARSRDEAGQSPMHIGCSSRTQRGVLKLDTATNKARQTVKQLASKGDVKSARILAKEVARSNKQKDRLSVSKARLGSIGNQLTQQMGENIKSFVLEMMLTMSCEAMAKVTGSLQKSTEIMKLSNQLIKLPQISQTMREMSMEMTKV